MTDYVANLMEEVQAKNPAEPEFHQAVHEVAESLVLVFERHPEYRSARILERMPHLRLAGEIERLPSNFINGPRRMPVEIE